MAVTANQLTAQQGCTRRGNFPIAASTIIYEGTLVFLTAAGYADDDTATGANYFGGVAVKQVDNSGGSAGDLRAEVYADGDFELSGSSFTQALVGNKIYATDNYTVTGTSTTATLIGYCTEYISATRIRVRLRTGEA